MSNAFSQYGQPRAPVHTPLGNPAFKLVEDLV